MTTLPAAGYISDNARTEGEGKQALEDMRSVIAQLPGGATAATSTLTIATGAVTPTTGIHLIDTEAAASTDDLDTINQTNLPDGSLLLIFAANASRTVVVKHNIGGTGKIVLVDAANLSLIGTSMSLLLKRTGTQWNEVSRFTGRLTPTVSAHKNGTDQTGVTSATQIKVTFGTEAWDIGGHFASSTWTPPAGKYRISAAVRFTTANAVDNEPLEMNVYKNGAAHKLYTARRGGSGSASVGHGWLVEANGTDTFEIYALKGGAGDGTIGGNAAETYFFGEAIA